MTRLGNALSDDVNVGNAANIKDEFERIRFMVNSPAITAASVDQYIFIAPMACTLESVNEIHITAGSSGSFQLTKEGSTGTIGSTGATNADLLSAALAFDTVVETVQAGAISAVSGATTLAAGDRIAIDFLSTGHASLAGGLITLTLYQNA